MPAVVFENVNSDSLPEALKKGASYSPKVTVTIENEDQSSVAAERSNFQDAIKAAVGIWKDRDDLYELYASMRRRRAERAKERLKAFE